MKGLILSIFLLLIYQTAIAQPVWTRCALEGDVCEFTGIKQVRYGAEQTWVIKVVKDGIDCNNDVFGDPWVGVSKACEYADVDIYVPYEPPPPLPGNTTQVFLGQNVWTNGVSAWIGSPSCGVSGMTLQSNSPAVDAGEIVEGHHCPNAGFQRVPGCVEWFGAAPDIGACEYVPIDIVIPVVTKPPIGTLTVEVIP